MELETGRNTVASQLEELGVPISDTITQELCPRMTAFITQHYSICGQIIHTHTDHFWIFSKNISAGLIFHRQFGNT